MYKYQSHTQSSIKRNNSIEGETIEMKLERVINNGEGVQGNAPMIYTERKDGIMPAYDIRTDRFDIAIDVS